MLTFLKSKSILRPRANSNGEYKQDTNLKFSGNDDDVVSKDVTNFDLS